MQNERARKEKQHFYRTVCVCVCVLKSGESLLWKCKYASYSTVQKKSIIAEELQSRFLINEMNGIIGIEDIISIRLLHNVLQCDHVGIRVIFSLSVLYLLRCLVLQHLYFSLPELVEPLLLTEGGI